MSGSEPATRLDVCECVMYLRLIEPLFTIRHLAPDDGADVLDDHGAFLDVSGGVQPEPLYTRAV